MIGEEKLEEDNKLDEHAVVVIFDGYTVGHNHAAASFEIFSLTTFTA